MGYPMDCPQRDERLGWFGDAMVSMEEAMFNFDMLPFYRQWLDGIRLNQDAATGDISIISPRPYMTEEPDPTWSSAFVIMNWDYYVQYGDRAFLGRQFESMRRYVDYLGTQATNHILPKYWIGDWGTIVKDWKEGEPVSVATALYYHDARIVAKAAAVLGKGKEARRYGDLADEIRAAFDRAFFDPVKQDYDGGTQFSNAFPLYLGLVPERRRALILDRILENLRRNGGHFDVGVLGAKYLVDALTDGGRPDVAYDLAVKTGYPSWAHMLEGGRTTLSEFWDLHGSHNHVMMGSIDGWFYRVLAGIQVDEEHPGFRSFAIRPFIPDSLGWVKASVQTLRGRVAVEWKKENGTLLMRAVIPVNSTAQIHMPCRSGQQVRTTPALSHSRVEKGAHVFDVGSGDYLFETPWQ
jgi:alpha-L-rhamnosidase